MQCSQGPRAVKTVSVQAKYCGSHVSIDIQGSVVTLEVPLGPHIPHAPALQVLKAQHLLAIFLIIPAHLVGYPQHETSALLSHSPPGPSSLTSAALDGEAKETHLASVTGLASDTRSAGALASLGVALVLQGAEWVTFAAVTRNKNEV